MAPPPAERGGGVLAGEVTVGRVRITTRSILVLVGILALGLVTRNVVARSGRVLGWVVAAAILAALLHPAVALVARRLRRGVALVVVLLGFAAPVALIGWAAVGDLRAETGRLQRALPDAAARLEASERWGRTARDLQLAGRVDDFVRQLPEQVAGGGTADALRSTATRGLAFLITAVLTVFLLSHGPRMVAAGIGQLGDRGRRARVAAVVGRAYQRAWAYAVGSLGMGVAAGVVAYLICRAARLPGTAVLAVLVGTFSIIPYVGVLVGSLPALLLAFGLHPVSLTAGLVVAAFLGYQLFEAVVLQRLLDQRTVRVGPVLPVVVAMVGFDVHGLGGAVCAIALTVYLAALAHELEPAGR